MILLRLAQLDIYTDFWTVKFQSIVRKNIQSDVAVEEAFERAREKIAARFKSSSTEIDPNKVNGYVLTAFTNAVRDVVRSQEGRLYTPVAIQRLGEVYVDLHKLLCHQKRDRNDIQSIISSRHQSNSTLIDQMIQEVRALDKKCAQKKRPVEVSIDDIPEQDIQTDSPEALLEQIDISAVFGAIMGEDGIHHDNLPLAVKQAIKEIQKCELDDNLRLLLKLEYIEGYSRSKAINEVNELDGSNSFSRSKARTKIKNLFLCLEKAFQTSGLELF